MPPARAQVALRVGVRVQGGWLSRFEITGLDRRLRARSRAPAAGSPAKTATATCREVEARPDGSVVLTFRERGAPHRIAACIGSCVAYTHAARSANGARVTWSLPPWGVDLENVSVDGRRAGAATALGAADEDDVAVQRERAELGSAHAAHFRRAQLPRTLPFAVAVRAAGRCGGAADDAGHARAARAARPLVARRRARPLLVLALCVAQAPRGARSVRAAAAAAAAAVRAARRRARRRHARARGRVCVRLRDARLARAALPRGRGRARARSRLRARAEPAAHARSGEPRGDRRQRAREWFGARRLVRRHRAARLRAARQRVRAGRAAPGAGPRARACGSRCCWS